MFAAATDSENDDRCGVDLCGLPAAAARLLLRRQPASAPTGEHLVSAAVSRHLLARHEQRHV